MPIKVVAGANNRGRQEFSKHLDRDRLPTRGGVYLIKGDGDNPDKVAEIDIYSHPGNGLCCFAGDYGVEGDHESVDNFCHVPVQCTGLNFIMWLGNSRRKST